MSPCSEKGKNAAIRIAIIPGRNNADPYKVGVVVMEMREVERDWESGEKLDGQEDLERCSCLINVC